MSKRSTVILSSLLALSVILNLVQVAVYPAPAQPVSLEGTYCADPGTEHTTYLVLTSEGNYCYYQPFRILEEGTYQQESGDTYVLTSSTEREGWKKLLFQEQEGQAYLLESGGAVTLFPKMGDTPYYNCVSPQYDEEARGRSRQ